MEILDYYKNHCEQLKNKIEEKSEKEISELIMSVLVFYLNFENFNAIVKKNIDIDICHEKLLEDLRTNNLTFYRIAYQKTLDKIDEYADDYEELEEIELLILAGFDFAIYEDRKLALFHLFDGIINMLDYYEQFSERPEYWNKMLETELSNQLDLLTQNTININFYQEKYNGIVFEKI